MRKIILAGLMLTGLLANSQNTIPTTTVNGTLKINDSLNVNKNIIAKGEVISKDTVRARKDVIVDGNALIGKKLKVDGKATFKNDIILKKSIQMDNNNEFSYIDATSSSREIFYLGNSNSKVLPYYACPNPNTNTSPIFLNNGAYVSRTPLGSGAGQTNSSISIYSAPWDGTGIIEVEGVSDDGVADNGLLINYFCGRNTSINTGWDLNPSSYKDGGTISMGAKVDMQKSLKIGYSTSGIDLNTALEINQNDNNSNGVKVVTYNNTLKAFSVFNSGSGYNKNTFVIYGDGKTRIGTKNLLDPHNDAMLGVDGKVACKSLFVLKPTSWADYVFKHENLENLKYVEEYINTYKHLPNIPSEEDIMKNGYDINEMDAKLLSKIEQLYLHIIELEKELNQLKNK